MERLIGALTRPLGTETTTPGTSSGAVAVQVVTREGRAVVGIEHVGSAHTDAELELLLEAAQRRLRSGQDAFDLGALGRRPARVEDVADWTTRRDELAVVEPAPGRPRAVAGGGRVVSTSALLFVAGPDQRVCPARVRGAR